MKAATISEMKRDLGDLPEKDLIELCLRLAKHKQENKELLSYLIYESSNEDRYIANVKAVISEEFGSINQQQYYLAKKGVRKLLKLCKKYIRFSKKKETEIELLLHFCCELKKMPLSYSNNIILSNLFDRQIVRIEKAISALHEDLQYDYHQELERVIA